MDREIAIGYNLWGEGGETQIFFRVSIRFDLSLLR